MIVIFCNFVERNHGFLMNFSFTLLQSEFIERKEDEGMAHGAGRSFLKRRTAGISLQCIVAIEIYAAHDNASKRGNLRQKKASLKEDMKEVRANVGWPLESRMWCQL